ncbi:MAG: heterodisulfide reductase, partial [bacterium]
VICPVCFYNLDALQRDALKAVGKTDGAEIPVLYLTELLALAMGANIAKLDLNHHISIEGILKKLGILLGKK